ncbi:MAG: SDR family NAD(P)-dependent oxidoreductase, partial [Glaciimonas sp.]|nr:SDR family NAD(P)-dependent oxidoreductase [Glaciimonas sp.]
MNSSSDYPSSATKVALVTDAASTLGRFISRALAGQGWDLALQYQPDDNAAATLALVKECEAMGRRAFVFSANLDDEIAVKQLVPSIISALGSLSCILNNASIAAHDRATDFSVVQLERHMRRNLSAPLLLSQALHTATPEG